jgi:hypothetical protein
VNNPPARHLGAILLGLVLFLAGLTPACQSKLSNPQELVTFLKVDLPGWKLAEGYPQAKRMEDQERSFLQAEGLFSSGKSTITVIIKEGEIGKEVAMCKQLKENDNEKDYCRKTRIQGFEAVEMVSQKLKSAFLFILVNNKCLVTMKITDAEDSRVLKELGNKINLPKLAALVK